jgi:hypothetical protein
VGGMGEVYRARDPKLGRDVALKILPATFSRDAEHLARFRREAQLLSRLTTHPARDAYPVWSQAIPIDWTRDGRYVVFDLVRPGTMNLRDLWALPAAGDSKPLRLTETPFTKFASRVSPDGRWIAYLSSESGSSELYVESFPKPGPRQQVSTNGAFMPRWAQDVRRNSDYGRAQLAGGTEKLNARRPNTKD